MVVRVVDDFPGATVPTNVQSTTKRLSDRVVRSTLKCVIDACFMNSQSLIVKYVDV